MADWRVTFSKRDAKGWDHFVRDVEMPTYTEAIMRVSAHLRKERPDYSSYSLTLLQRVERGIDVEGVPA